MSSRSLDDAMCPYLSGAPSTGEQTMPTMNNNSMVGSGAPTTGQILTSATGGGNSMGTSPLPGHGSQDNLARSGTPGGGQTPAVSSILGFAPADKDFLKSGKTMVGCPHGGKPDEGKKDEEKSGVDLCHYSDYLGVEQLLRLQAGPAGSKQGGQGLVHHEELTFIIVHQVFELWFKLVTADLIKAREFLSQVERESAEFRHNRLTECLQYLRRAEAIFHHVQGAFGVMETMHPGDFIEFRDFLVPASGFQSVGFRSLEQLLGVANEGRQKVNQREVFEYLKDDERARLVTEKQIPSLNQMLLMIAANISIPENFEDVFVSTYKKILEEQQYEIVGLPRDNAKAAKMIEKGVADMRQMMDDPVTWSEGLFLAPRDPEAPGLYKKAVMGCLLAISYRHDPRFSLFAQVCDQLIAVEEGLLLWRSRHSHMAERMIGRRLGTGGSSGIGYLDVTRRYRVFHCLWLVRKMLTRSSSLPPLSFFEGYTEAPFWKEIPPEGQYDATPPKRSEE